MELHRVASILLHSLLLASTPRSEAKLGAPPPSDDDAYLLRSATRRSLGLAPSSCKENPDEFRYYTSTNGTPRTSCFKIAVQLSRGAINSRQMVNKCRQRLVGSDDRYGAGSTVADVCPLICGRPCPAGGGDDGGDEGVETQDASQVDLSSPDVPDGEIRLPKNSDSDEDIASMLQEEVQQGTAAQQADDSVVIAIEERPTPTIASFGKFLTSRDFK